MSSPLLPGRTGEVLHTWYQRVQVPARVILAGSAVAAFVKVLGLDLEHAVFLGVGAPLGVGLKVPGAHARGVTEAMSFLRQYNIRGSVPVGPSGRVEAIVDPSASGSGQGDQFLHVADIALIFRGQFDGDIYILEFAFHVFQQFKGASERLGFLSKIGGLPFIVPYGRVAHFMLDSLQLFIHSHQIKRALYRVELVSQFLNL